MESSAVRLNDYIEDCHDSKVFNELYKTCVVVNTVSVIVGEYFFLFFTNIDILQYTVDILQYLLQYTVFYL